MDNERPHWEEKVLLSFKPAASSVEADVQIAAALDQIRQDGSPLGMAVLRLDTRVRDVVVLRLTGLHEEETAMLLSVSSRTVRRLFDIGRRALLADENVLLWKATGLVEARVDFRQVIAELAKEPASLFKLPPYRFEEVIAEIWKRFGYDVELTKRTRDGGHDIIAVQFKPAKVKFLIECKRYAPDGKIHIGIVRALYGVKTDAHATKGILAATCPLTKPAREFVSAHQWELEAHEHNSVIEWIQTAARWDRALG